MNQANLRSISNHFHDVHLISLRNWKMASEIMPRDRGGPYMISQAGYQPKDLKMLADEFVLGRSGKWISVGLFFKLPIQMRRAEFIFGTAAEVMQLMQSLPSQVTVWDQTDVAVEPAAVTEHDDDLNNAFHTARQVPSVGS